MGNIFETKSSFHVKQRTTGKVQFLFFENFLLVLTRFLFWEEDWALCQILLKSDSHVSKKNSFIFFNESPLKMIKNDSYFILKAKIRLISKFITSQPGQQAMTIHTLLNTSRSKSKQ